MNFFRYLKKHWLTIVFVLLFFISRYYVITHPEYRPHDPKHAFSDVKHYYERYANTWYYGLKPYLQHYYEYPPTTVPMLYYPLVLDQNGIGKYYSNYRLEILLIDILLFVFILIAFKKLKMKSINRSISMAFFTIMPLLLVDFWYEGIDLAFAGALSISAILLLFRKKNNILSHLSSWIFLWLSTSIKFMSLPLLPIIFYLNKLNLKKSIFIGILSFLIVWGLPLAIYRSSLSVSVVFHLKREPKYASLPSFLAENVNKFTHTEHRLDKPPDFPMLGPYSTKIKHAFSLVFYLGIILSIILGIWQIFNYDKKLSSLFKKLLNPFIAKIDNYEAFQIMLKYSLILVFIIMLTGKIVSKPFQIWYVPLLTIYPFKNIGIQLKFLFLALATGFINIASLPVYHKPIFFALDGSFFISGLRFIPMIIMLIWLFKLEVYAKNSQ